MTTNKPDDKQNPDRKPKNKKGVAMDSRTIGRWALILGLVLAVVIALVPDINEAAIWVMLLLGLFVGWVVFGDDENAATFILIAIGLAVFSDSLAGFPTLGEFLTDILFNLATFLGTAVIGVVARHIVGWFTD